MLYQWIHSCFFSHTLPVLLTYQIIIIHSILLSSLPVITTSVKLSQMNVPEIVYHGESTWLNCSYDLQNEPLYSVKWFKKNENEVKEEYIWSEIYRFEPNNGENTKVSFPMKGVMIDLIKSSQGNVLLTNISMETEGTYRCEVVGDAPSFETVRDERHMKVYYFAQNQPIIRGVKRSYQIGDYVHANCSITFPKSHFKSMTRLLWYINGEAAPQAFVSTVKGRRMLSSLVSTNNMYNDEDGIREEKSRTSGPTRRDQFKSDDQEISDEPSWNLDTTSFGINNVMANSIKFLVNPRHFNHGILRLKCTASTIPDLYSRSAEETARQESVKGPSTHNPGRYSSSGLSFFHRQSSGMTIFLVVVWLTRLWIS